ncbi:MAG TPA: class I SAM-dependent methyltransferase [Ktedonobacterales bacterium]|jgi:ubiquinone/menaquinone biosynthesis C-methylase UbiE|nr:class I SAM-dependent methyltransferase [Ktedonobacterales bacterium]
MAIIERPGVALDPEEAETRAIHDLIDFTGRDVLEIGCGEGRLTRRFASGARSVLGVDLDAESIALAPAQLPESLRSVVTFQVADITALELPTAAFDVAILSWSL